MRSSFWFKAAGFVGLYLLFDWLSYVEPLFGLNITPWNPDPAVGVLFWMRYGRRAALPWFLALVAGEVLVRGMPAGPAVTLIGSAWLTVGYGLIGEALRRQFGRAELLRTRDNLFRWLSTIAVGSLLNGGIYVGLLKAAGLIPAEEWMMATWRIAIGDMVGAVVTMPLLWMVLDTGSRERLRAAVWRLETLGYLTLAIFVLWAVFGYILTSQFKHFYFLFLPVIWAAARQGVYGAALIVFVVQLAVVTLVKANRGPDISVHELQMLDAVLALVAFFIGIVVDERRRTEDELKQTLRLAAAGEMAAALAHELNQPMTALGAYGKACEHLLARGETGELLKNAIGQMIAESARAAEVVRRLRDFFRTGAMHLESVSVAALLSGIVQQFRMAFSEHGVVLELSAEPAAGTPLAVQVDRLQMELVLRNLLVNALDAVRAQPAGARRIKVQAETVGGKLRLTVEDSGKGVSTEMAKRLFEPFVSSKASGMGLGLVLSRAIVEAHGGSLWAEVGDHGVFRFILPALETGDQIGK